MPTLRHFQIFVEVATCKKMGEAAQNLYLSQSTVSQAISEMEKYYNVLLFERLSKRLLITEAGRSLLSDAKALLADYDCLEERMRDLSQMQILRIGVSGSAAAYYVEPVVDMLMEKFPSIHMEVHSYSNSYIRSCLQNNTLDIGILTAPASNPDLVSIPAFTDQLRFVCGQGHPFYDRDVVSVRELCGQTFVLQEISDGSRQMLEDFLRQNQISYSTDWTSNSIETLKVWLEHNRGIALMSEAQIRSECAVGLLKTFRVEGVNLCRQLNAFYHRNKYLSKPLKAFLSGCPHTS